MRTFLSVDELIAIHKYLIDEFGGPHGLRDRNALESAAMRPQSGYYKNIYEEAAALMESLGMNHPFVDGNKRMAFFATDIFLRLNGIYIDCDDQEAYEFLLGLLESNSFNFESLANWLKDNSKDL